MKEIFMLNGLWEEWILDISSVDEQGVACFCPIERDQDGSIKSIVWGMNYLTPRCPGKLVGLAAQGYTDADVHQWSEDNKNWYEKYKKEDV